MKLHVFRANATDINKTPTDVRYVFILKWNDGRKFIVGALTTFRTLSENVKLKPISIRVVDLKTNIVSYLRVEEIDNFLDEWRENYFNPDWNIPFQFFK